jgi:hypothetical protein
MTNYTTTRPTDPESDALRLLIHAAESATGSTALREPMTDLAGALLAEQAFTGLVWGDARLAAAAIAHDAATVDDAAHALRCRAADLRAGRFAAWCADPEGVARALTIAATVLASM